MKPIAFTFKSLSFISFPLVWKPTNHFIGSTVCGKIEIHTKKTTEQIRTNTLKFFCTLREPNIHNIHIHRRVLLLQHELNAKRNFVYLCVWRIMYKIVCSRLCMYAIAVNEHARQCDVLNTAKEFSPVSTVA